MPTIRGSQKIAAALVLSAMCLTGSIPAHADREIGGPDIDAGHLSLGGRGTYLNPRNGDSVWYGGGQVRLHLTPVIALEASADLRQTDVGPTKVDVFPVQASLLGYLMPGKPVSPFVLAGAGAYFTHVDGPGIDDTDHRFGVHAGGGLQFFLNKHWSIDTTYRYIWVDDVEVRDASLNPSEYKDEGHMITAGLNLHF